MTRQHVLLLVCTSVFSLVYAIHERSNANEAAHSRDQLGANLAAARAEIQTLSSRLDALTAANASAPALSSPAPSRMESSPLGRRRTVARSNARQKNTEDPRWKRMQSQLAEHQSQIAEQSQRIAQTQEDVRKSGDQLDGKINSTRDELNRSIATTHEDVVLLQKRGERNIYEFDLARSKEFQRVGPLSLSLKKADTKHRSYNLALMVDDKPVEKQHVNLFEPVWVTLSDSPQPIQLVVNQIDKNRIRGYVSEPRYKKSDLAGAPPAPGTAQAPALKSR
jgi:hypothetical protein